MIILCVFLLLPVSLSVVAAPEEFDSSSVGMGGGRNAKRWVNHNSEQYRGIYGENATIDGVSNPLDDNYDSAETGLLSGLLGEFLGNVADIVYEIFNTANVDLTIDGIVYGRVKSTTTLTRVDGQWVDMQMNLAHFGLEKNNAWGIFGSTLYFVLRERFAFILIPVVGIIMLGKEAFKGGEKGRAGVKAVMGKTVAFFVIMYAAPFILEAYIYLRDVLMVVVRDGLSGPLTGLNGSIVGTGGIYTSIRNSWNELGHPFLLGLIMIGYAGAGLVYFWDYIRIALLIAAVFGLFPLILIWWFFKPKILTDWLNLILPSLLTPFIDMVLLLAPCFVMAIFQRVFQVSGERAGASIILAFTVLICIWVMRNIRDRILKLFGFEGVRGGSGGLGLALAMLARNFGGGNQGNGNAGGRDSGVESRENASYGAERMRETGEVMENADNAIAEINSDDYEPYSDSESGTDDFIDEMDGESMDDVSEDTVSSEGVVGEETSDIVLDEGKEDISGVQSAIGDEDVVMDTNAEDVGIATGEGGSQLAAVPDGVADLGEVPIGGINESGSVATSRAELPVSVLSEEQSKFVSGFSDRDKKRFDNLQQMDSLESGIARNERIMAESGYTRGAYEAAVSKRGELSNRMKSLDAEKSDFAKRLGVLENEKTSGSITGDEYSRRRDAIVTEQRRNANAINEVQAAQVANNSYIESMKTSYMAERQNIAFRQELDARKGVESQYAHNSGLGGMSTKSYSNANDFLYQKRVDEIKKKHVNYSNFDTKQYENILSPSEREELYRKRATRATMDRVERIVENTASVGLGTVTAAAAMFAGPGAMAGAAMAGGSVVKKVAQVTKPVVNSVAKVAGTAGEKLYSALDVKSDGGDGNSNTVKTGGSNTQISSAGNVELYGGSAEETAVVQKPKAGNLADREKKERNDYAKKYVD